MVFKSPEIDEVDGDVSVEVVTVVVDEWSINFLPNLNVEITIVILIICHFLD